MCTGEGLGIAELVLANEDAMRPRGETEAGLDAIAQAMEGQDLVPAVTCAAPSVTTWCSSTSGRN